MSRFPFITPLRIHYHEGPFRDVLPPEIRNADGDRVVPSTTSIVEAFNQRAVLLKLLREFTNSPEIAGMPMDGELAAILVDSRAVIAEVEASL